MKLRIYGENPKLCQWDTSRRLVVEDADGCDRVYFGRAGLDSAPVLPIRQEDGLHLVDIPNLILQSHGNFTAYLYLCDENGTQTRYEQKFYVNQCPKPDAYVYTETEVLSYASLDNRLTTLEGEGLANAVAAYLEENPVQSGATAEEAAQIEQNASDIAALQQAQSNGIKNPSALTFTGAVDAVYDGSEAMAVMIPSGGNEWTLLADVTLKEAVRTVDLAIDAVNCKEIFILQNVSCGESSTQQETVYISGEKNSIVRGVIGGLPIVKNTGYYGWSAIRLKIDAGRVFSEWVYSDFAMSTPETVNTNLGYGKGTRHDNVAVIEETAFKAIRLQCSSGTVTFSAGSSFKVWGR